MNNSDSDRTKMLSKVAESRELWSKNTCFLIEICMLMFRKRCKGKGVKDGAKKEPEPKRNNFGFATLPESAEDFSPRSSLLNTEWRELKCTGVSCPYAEF